MSTNPDLLNPATGSDPTSGIPARKPFRNMVDGQWVESTAPLSPTLLEEFKYFFCEVPVASMHRTDGKIIPFVNQVCETNIAQDISYLENEIRGGNKYLRYATATEVEMFKMLRDPRGTMEASIKANLANDPEYQAELEAKIRAKIAAEQADPTTPADVLKGDQVKLSGIDSRLAALKGAGAAPTTNTQTVVSEPHTGSAATIKVGGQSTMDTKPLTKPLMESAPAPLKGIVGSDTVTEAAAGFST